MTANDPAEKKSRQVRRREFRKAVNPPQYQPPSPYGLRAARRRQAKASAVPSSRHTRKPHVNHCTKLKSK